MVANSLPTCSTSRTVADGLTASVQVAALGQGDQLFDERTQFLGLGQGGDDLLVLDQRGRHVGEHGGAVSGRTAQFTVSFTVTHCGLSWALARCSAMKKR